MKSNILMATPFVESLDDSGEQAQARCRSERFLSAASKTFSPMPLAFHSHPEGTGPPPLRCRRLKVLNVRATMALLFSLAVLSATAGQNQKEAQAFFDSTNLTVFHVEVDAVDVGQLAQRPKDYVPGRVRVGEQTWNKVGIRLKGSGTFQPIFAHPSLALKFNWKEPHQRFSGVTKLFLENSAQDATLMCKLIANGAFGDAGIPAPRITQARVYLNGRDLGPCVVAEAINKDFLQHHFGNSDGNMYEAFFQDLNGGLKQDNGKPGDRSDLRELCQAAMKSDYVERCHALSRLLDTEAFLNFLATEMILANWDGYVFHQNNYRVYHDPGSGRMSFIPHDLDNTLFESGMGLMPPRNGLLTAALLQTPDARKAFRERLASLIPIVLNSQKIQGRLQASLDRLTQIAATNQLPVLQRQAGLLERRIQERRQHLADELAGRHPLVPAFDSNGVAVLSGWFAKPDWNNAVAKTVVEDGKSLLCVEAVGNYCFGSWRLPVWLPAGKYRIEGEAKSRAADGLPSRTGSGAGVRVVGGRRGGGIQGSSPWAAVRHNFEVQEDCEWVELIAELRAYSGTAWFDPESLRLVRLK